MIVAGIGCQSDCSAAEIIALIESATRLCNTPINRLATLARRASLPQIQFTAAHLGVALVALEPAALRAEQPRCPTHSPIVQRATGLGSVAEAAALAAAGPHSRLILPRIASARATCALAASAE